MKRILLFVIIVLGLNVFLMNQANAGAPWSEKPKVVDTETGCDNTSGYPRDCITLPTGSGTFISYMTPKGQIPSAFNAQTGYYKVVYWPSGCCSGSSSVLVKSGTKTLDNDGVLRGITFNNGGAGWY